MEYDGKTIIQSMSMARLIAKDGGLAGKNNVEAAMADMYVDCIADFINKSECCYSAKVEHYLDFKQNSYFSVALPIMFEKDEGKKKELSEKMKNEDFPAFLKNFTKALKDNGGKFLVGGELTYADIGLATVLFGVANRFGEGWKKTAPELAAHMDSVYSLPKIKKWIEVRPKNDK